MRNWVAVSATGLVVTLLSACSGPPVASTPSPQILCQPAPSPAASDTLTCNQAVTAALGVLPVPHPAITRIDFGYGWYCPPGSFCGLNPTNRGYVVFSMATPGSDEMVEVTKDAHGTLSTGSVMAFPPVVPTPTAPPTPMPATPTPVPTPPPLAIGTPQPGDGTVATRLMDDYQTALVDGAWRTAWNLLAAEMQAHWVTYTQFVSQQTAFYRGVAGRYVVDPPTHDPATILNWVVPENYPVNPIWPTTCDYDRAFIVNVHYPAMLGSNNGYRTYLVAPDQGGTWKIWWLR